MASQIETFAAELLPQALIGGLKIIAKREEPDFRGGIAAGEQPIVIPGTPFKRRRANPELVLPDRIAQDDGKHRKRARQQRHGEPYAKTRKHDQHGDQRDAIR